MSVLATLSLIASFASVSNVPLPLPISGGERGARVAQSDDTAPPRTAAGSGGQAEREVASRGSVAPATAAASPDSTRELARWLEALTYAVMALAGFAAAGVVLLLRIGSHLARIAER